MSDFGRDVVYDARMGTDKNNTVRDNGRSPFRRTRFLASVIMSSPTVAFVYSPLLIVQTVAGIAVPFATGRFIDALVGGLPPVTPFILLAALLLARAVTQTLCALLPSVL